MFETSSKILTSALIPYYKDRKKVKPFEITIGNVDPGEFSDLLISRGARTVKKAEEIFDIPAFVNNVAREKKCIRLCKATTYEILGKKGTLFEILSGIEKMGGRARSEIGPQLRLQYLHQPKDEWLAVAMPAIINKHGETLIFNMGWNGNWPELRTLFDMSSFPWGEHLVWVFEVLDL